MDFSLSDLNHLLKDFKDTWPQDLIDDLAEKEPQIGQQLQDLQSLISEKASQISQEELPPKTPEVSVPKKRPSPIHIKLKPSLVSPKWDEIQKGRINWDDFKNLLLFYALGKMQVANSDLVLLQKEEDLHQLRLAIEEFPLLKNQKPQTAEQRVNQKTSYLSFGKKVIDALMNNSSTVNHDSDREIQDADETSSFNATKLGLTKKIALNVFYTLKKRYGNEK